MSDFNKLVSLLGTMKENPFGSEFEDCCGYLSFMIVDLDVGQMRDQLLDHKPIEVWDKTTYLFKYECPKCRKQVASRGDNKTVDKMKKVNFCSNCGTKLNYGSIKGK